MDRLLEAFLRRIVKFGNYTIRTSSGHEFTIGDGSGKPLTITLTDKAAEVRLLRDPALTLGELYMAGQLLIEGGDIFDLHMAAQRNISAADMSTVLRLADRMRFMIRGLKQNNHMRRARSNVAHHYDLDGRLYSLFLDPDMQYSCGYFEHADSTLEEAQLAKKRHIVAKMDVQQGDRVLDIGCGWGGLAMSLAGAADVEVVGLTLSEPQLQTARHRAQEAGLDNRVTFLNQDYRQHSGIYDRIVSVGMFEHVGINHYRTFFDQVARLLNDDGVCVLHTIGRAAGPGATDPWIQRYIFPGGYSPALSKILPHIERARLWATDVEVMRLHYAETIRHWRRRFLAKRDEVIELYNEEFARMWEYYLVVSEIAFRRLDSVVFQIQIAKSQDTLPLTREYMWSGNDDTEFSESRNTDSHRRSA